MDDVFADGNGSFLKYGTLPPRLIEHKNSFLKSLSDVRPDLNLQTAGGRIGDISPQLSIQFLSGLKAAEASSRSKASPRAQSSVKTLAQLDLPLPVEAPVGTLSGRSWGFQDGFISWSCSVILDLHLSCTTHVHRNEHFPRDILETKVSSAGCA